MTGNDSTGGRTGGSGGKTALAVALTALMVLSVLAPAAAGTGAAADGASTDVETAGATSVGGEPSDATNLDPAPESTDGSAPAPESTDGSAPAPESTDGSAPAPESTDGSAPAPEPGTGDVARSEPSSLATVSVSGTVTGPDGLARTNDVISFRASGGSVSNFTDPNGRYAVDINTSTSYDVVYRQYGTNVSYPTDGIVDIYAFGVESYTNSTQVDRTVPQGHRLNVTVVDQSGTPIENASVDVAHVNGDARAFAFGRTTADGLWVPSDATDAGIEVNGTVEVYASGPAGSNYGENFTTVEVTGPRSVTLTLSETVILDGTLTYANGTAASGVSLEASPTEPGSFGDLDVTDANGRFSLRVPANETFEVNYFQGDRTQPFNATRFPRDGFSDFRSLGSFALSANRTVDLTVPATGTLNVTVQDQSGAPVENASVFVIHRNGSSDTVFSRYENRLGVPTDSQGRMFHPGNDRPGVEIDGQVDVYVRRPLNTNYGNNSTSLDVTGDTQVTLTLEERVSLSAGLRGPDGSRIGNATVVFFNESDVQTVTTGEFGGFSVELRNETTYRVAYWQGPVDVDETAPFPRDGVADFHLLGTYRASGPGEANFRVPPGDTLNVTVVDDLGNPVENATVALVPNGSAPTDFYGYRNETGLPTDADGRMVHPPNGVPGVELNGTYDVFVQAPPGSGLEGNATTVTVDGDRSATVVLPGAAEGLNITGQLYVGDFPLANATVFGFGPGGPVARTDATGEFVLDPVQRNATYNVVSYQIDQVGNHDGRPDVFAVAAVRTNDSSVDLGFRTLPRAHVVNVTVVDGSGDPVRNATVEIVHTGPEGARGGFAPRTNAAGIVRVSAGADPGVELAGDVRINVTRPHNSTAFAPERKVRDVFVQSPRNFTFVINRTRVIPDSVSFGEVEAGTTATREVTVTNNGDDDLTVAGVRVDGNATFAVADGGTTTLAPGENATVTVEFTPGTAGAFSGTLVFENPGPSGNQTLTVPLSGSGVEEDGDPAISLSTNSVNFGRVEPGESVSRTIVVTNVGEDTANVTGAAVRTNAAGTFGTSGAGFQLAPDESRTITVRFAPSSIGRYEGTLLVRSDAPGSPHRASLSGRARGTPEVSVQPRSVDFGNAPVGETVNLSLVVSNDGSGPLALQDVSVTGSNAFAVVGDPPSVLAPGEQVTVEVAFAAGDPGEYNGRLEVATNDSDRRTVTVPLLARAVDGEFELQPASVQFDSTSVGESANTTVRVVNTGEADVEISSVGIVGADLSSFAVSGDATGTLAPGESRTVTVRFEPDSAGAKTARLRVRGGDGTVLTTALSGQGTQPRVTVSTSSINFGNVTVGERVTATLTVRNDGSETLSVTRGQITGANAAAFEIFGAGSPFELEPGESRELTIAFNPGSQGAKSAILRLSTNDPRRPVANVWLSNTDTRVDISTEGDPDGDNVSRVNVNVQDAEAGSELSLNVSNPQAADQTAQLEEMNLSVAEGGNFTLNVTESEQPLETTGEFTPNETKATVPAGYVNVSHTVEDENISEVSFTFRMSRAALDRRDANASEVTLYRDVDGEWVPLDTEVVERRDDYVVLRGFSPGLSDFVAGIEQPSFELVEASVDVDRIDVGGQVGVEVTIDNEGGAAGTFRARLLLNGEVVDRQTVTVAGGGRRVVVFEREIGEAGTYTVEVNEVEVGQIEVESTTTAGTATADGPGSQETSTTIPGFGPATALLALAVLAVAVARRRRRR